ncbi:hypothetical protein M1247_34765 [Mycobacterium sp. 21AC1]|uniref:Rv1733c family protein n=1 Tax=[Mycobacterium] appelbergii TaxID=2939269 RepID=UPI002938D640|nr:hypothetical protein [Mycobacterium sp. 21AC1]MDV3130110.1 hypothetical protein [Mycobacterium sp. 21AC1]
MRRADRVEALTVVLMMIAAVLIIPFAAGVGDDLHAEALRTAEAQAKTRIPVQATATADSETTLEAPSPSIVNVQWTAAGSVHTGAVRPPGPVKSGDHVQIWIDDQGRRVPPPISASSAAAYGNGAAVATWLGAALVGVLAIAATRRLANRYRYRVWSSELQVLLDRGDGRTKWPG